MAFLALMHWIARVSSLTKVSILPWAALRVCASTILTDMALAMTLTTSTRGLDFSEVKVDSGVLDE